MAASGELLHSKAIHFFRIILHSTLQDGKLCFRRGFRGGGLPNPVFLKAPDGTEWKVCWKKQEGEIWFEDGWKEFVEYFSLDFGYFIMFKYEDGASTFEVIILDMSTLEIDYPSHEKGTQDESVEILEMPSRKKENRPRSPLKSLRPLKKLRTSTGGEEGRGSEMSSGRASEMQKLRLNEKAKTTKQELEGAALHPTADRENPERGPHNNITSVFPMTKSLRPLMKLRTSTDGEEGRASDLQILCLKERAKTSKQELEGAKRHPSKPGLEDKMERTSFSPERCGKSMAISRMEPLSLAEKARALERVSSFTPRNPFFKIPIQPSYVSGNTLNLPAGFSRKLLMKRGDVVLQVSDGRKWSAFYTCGLLGGKFKAKIQTGWKSFSQGNNLKVGDVCIFELIKSTVITFKVHIFRAAENLSCLPSQDRENPERGPCNNLTSACPMTMSDLKGLPTPNKHKLEGKCSEDIVTSPQVHRRMKISAENAAFVKVGRPSPQALEDVRSFSSENAFFRVNISPSLLQRGKLCGRPNVPVVFLKNVMNSREKNMMIQLGKRSWPVKLLYYPHLSKGNLSVGWCSFAEESKLQQGDVCIFELIDRESAVLKVHIFRPPT